jgi:precorrin-6A synthase
VTVRVLVIGIGTGNPEHLTREAVHALNQVDVFLVADKGEDKDDLVRLRDDICQATITGDYRLVEVVDPPRGPDRDRDQSAYLAGVDSWHQRRALRYAEVIRAELGTNGTVGFLVWGDPALYDSTIRVVELIAASGLELQLEVIPGISSLSLLAARHRIVLNRVGQPIHITTGRRLLEEYSPALGDVAVMLDGHLTCRGLVQAYPDLRIFWGAQLGLPDECLVSGTLVEVLPDIEQIRGEARQRRGWVMDTYLLRSARPATEPRPT